MSKVAIIPEPALSKAQGVVDRFATALEKANVEKPLKAHRDELDSLLREYPLLWELSGDLMDHAAEKLMQSIDGTYAYKATLKTSWKEMPKRLTQPEDGALEKLIVKQAVLSWMQLGYVENQYNAILTQGNNTIAMADFWERRLSATQRRYLRAVEALARVRRLKLPTVQVNIGAQQVNQVNQNG